MKKSDHATEVRASRTDGVVVSRKDMEVRRADHQAKRQREKFHILARSAP
jgi:hypothetical protein